MNQSSSRSLVVGLAAGAGLTALAALMLGQGASQPVKSTPEYFVTADGEGAHLWVREGVTLRVVAHGECKECPNDHAGHDHHEGDGHDHGKPDSRK